MRPARRPRSIQRRLAVLRWHHETKRAYEPASPSDGKRFLVERPWPRGVSKTELQLDGRLKDAAPSPDLRRWFSHDPAKWDTFKKRYRAELDANPSARKGLLEAAHKGNLTLVYGSRDREHNSAEVLKKYLEKKAI